MVPNMMVLKYVLILLCIAGYKADDNNEHPLKYHMSGDSIWYINGQEMQGVFQIDTDLSLNLSTVQRGSMILNEITRFDFSTGKMYAYLMTQTRLSVKSCNVFDLNDLKFDLIEGDLFQFPFIAIAKIARQPELIAAGTDTTFNGIEAKMVESNLKVNANADVKVKTIWKKDDLRLLGFYNVAEGDAKPPRYTVFDFFLDATKPGVFDPPANLYCEERNLTANLPDFGDIVGVTIHSNRINGVSGSGSISVDLKNDYSIIQEDFSGKYTILIEDVNSESMYRTTSPVQCEASKISKPNLLSRNDTKLLHQYILFQNTDGVHYLGDKVIRNIPCSVYQVPLQFAVETIMSWCIAEGNIDSDSNNIPLIQVELYRDGKLGQQQDVALVQKERQLKIRTTYSLDMSTCFEDRSEKLQFEIKVEKEVVPFLLNPKVLEEFYRYLYYYAGLEITSLRFTDPKMTRSGEQMYFQFTLLEQHPDLPPFDNMTPELIKNKLTKVIDDGQYLISMPIDSKTIKFEALKGSLKQQFQYTTSSFPITTIPTPDVTDSTLKVTGSTHEVTGSTPKVTGSTPKVTGSTAEVTGSTPEVTGSTPEVTGSTAEVTDSTTEVTGSTPKVTGSTAEITGVSHDSSTSTSATTIITTPTDETPEIVSLLSGGTFGGVAAAMLIVGALMGTTGTYVKLVYMKKR